MKYLCNNILCYDAALLLCFMIDNVVIHKQRLLYFFAENLCILCGLFAVTGFSVERYFALSSPLKYMKYFKTTYIKTFVWLLLIYYFSAILVLGSLITTSERINKVLRQTLFCWIGAGLHISLTAICLACNFKSVLILKRQMSQVTVFTSGVTARFGSVNGLISIVCVLYCLIHLPVNIEAVVRKCDFHLESLYTFSILIVGSVINPMVYVWRFRECRLQGLIYLSMFPGFRYLENTVRNRRINIFDIPTIYNR